MCWECDTEKIPPHSNPPANLIWRASISNLARWPWFFSFLQTNSYDQKLQPVPRPPSNGSFSTKLPFWFDRRYCGFLLPGWRQPSDLHRGQSSLFSSTEPIYFRLRRGGGLTNTPSSSAGWLLLTGKGWELNHTRRECPSTRHTLTKGFILIKSHLEEMKYPPAVSVNLFFLVRPLLCVEIKFLN